MELLGIKERMLVFFIILIKNYQHEGVSVMSSKHMSLQSRDIQRRVKHCHCFQRTYSLGNNLQVGLYVNITKADCKVLLTTPREVRKALLIKWL